MIFTKEQQELLLQNEKLFEIVLSDIAHILEKSHNGGQSKVAYRLLELLREHQLEDFMKSINGVDMWGGSGAVWEVYIEEENAARNFEKLMLVLIQLMEEIRIAGRGASSVKSIFERNLKH